MNSLKALASHLWTLAALTAFAAPSVICAQTTDTSTAQSSASASNTGKPNILMIYIDDMGYGDISSFSDKLSVKTPNIDRLAKQGMKFTQFYVAMPICSPSRAAVISGTFSPENQLTDYLQTRKGNYLSDQNDFVDPARAYLPKSFKNAGYALAHVGKWHMGGGRDVNNAPSILKYGYDEAYSTWESPNRDPKLGTNYAPWDTKLDPGQVPRYRRTEYMVDKTLDFMKRKKGQPIFVTLWPDDLHTPYRPSPEMIKKYHGTAEVNHDADRKIQNFRGVLEEMDKQIGRLLDGLKAQGMEDNTIVFLTGDNGPAPKYNRKRTDGMRGMKLSLYEGGIREPFIIRWPGHVPADTENDVTVMNAVDLLPTLTSLAGVPMSPAAQKAADGVDMSKAILGKEKIIREKPMMWEFGRTNHVPRPRPKSGDKSPTLAIREGNFKLLVNRDGSDVELYDVVKDRNETKNIADQHPDMVKKMSKTVIDWSKTLPHRTHPYPWPNAGDDQTTK